MSILSEVQTGSQKRARRIFLYATHGWGKTTWASQFEDCLFLQTEDGCADLDVARTPLITDLDTLWGATMDLGSGSHSYKAVVIDTWDWAERLIHKTVCQKHGKQAITDFEYGKGYGEATEIARKILGALNVVRDQGMHVVLLGHCQLVRFTEPGMESYDRYAPKLHRDASALVQEWADEVLCGGFKRFVRKEDLGFNKTRGIAAGEERVIYTCEGAGHFAKSRLPLPAEMTTDFSEFAQYL